MSRSGMLRLFSLIVLMVAAQGAWAATPVTYVVGSCKPKSASFATITEALNALPAPEVVQVCPGTYNEQVVITQSVTVQGITVGNAAQPVLAVPSGGLQESATNTFGDMVAPQIWISNAVGPVSISNITIDASGHGITDLSQIVGVLSQNSTVTVNHVTTRNQKGNGFGTGFWLEGGAATPTVIVENSSIHDFDNGAFVVVTDSVDSEISATITANRMTGATAFNAPIQLLKGETTTVSNNYVTNAITAIEADAGSAGSITGNTLSGSSYGVALISATDVNVTSNKIFNSGITGIYIASQGTPVVTGNVIFYSASAGIDLFCAANPNVHSNTIEDAPIGINHAGAVVLNNTYVNVGTIRGSC